MNRKIIASAIALSLIAGIAGCSSDTTEQTTVAPSTEATETTVAEETTTEATTEVTETTAAEIEIPDFDYESLPTFEVTSANLNNGVWDDIITNTSAGENKSPELSWESIDEATTYVVYMVDTSAGNWLHLKVGDITTTSLEEGSITSSLQYVGPYPPSGTHDYVVYVFALRSTPTKIRGVMDINNSSLDFIFASLDVNESGETGNVVSYGMLTGTYTAK